MPEVYRYPLTAYTEKTDYLQIDIVEYKPIGKNLRGVAGKGGTTVFKSLASQAGSRTIGREGKNKLATILLPMPSNVSDSLGVEYASSSLNNIAGAAIGGIADLMTSAGGALGGGEGIQGAITKAGEKAAETLTATASAAGGLTGIQGFATRQLASSAAGILGANITPSQLLARSTGEVLNPNMELLFSGPTLRTFRFQYQMTPRSFDEGQSIKQIIRSFKAHSSVKVGSTNQGFSDDQGTFIRTPDVFELRYMQGADDHSYLHKFKQCFLESINVNYSGAGNYSTYEDGTPVSMIMDLTFREIEPIYDIDQLQAMKEGKVGY